VEGDLQTGPSEAPDQQAPTWPEPAMIWLEDTVLHWSAAHDESGIARYVVYQDGVGVREVEEQHVDVVGLLPEWVTVFQVQAVDTEGNLSMDGPRLVVDAPEPVMANGIRHTEYDFETAEFYWPPEFYDCSSTYEVRDSGHPSLLGCATCDHAWRLEFLALNRQCGNWENLEGYYLDVGVDVDANQLWFNVNEGQGWLLWSGITTATPNSVMHEFYVDYTDYAMLDRIELHW